MRSLFWNIDLFEKNVYKDTSVINSLTSFADIGIFSKGDPEFQKIKLEKTGILNLFKQEKMHIFDDKDINLIQVIDLYKNSKLFLVDDKLETLCSAKKHKSDIFTVWVKRGPYAQAQDNIEGFVPNVTIDNLSNLSEIISSNL